MAVLVVAVVTGLLGRWQLSRHDEVRTRNQVLAGRLALEPASLADVSMADPESIEQVRVRVAGSWDLDNEVVLRNRARRDVNGNLVMTPLVLDDGARLMIVRGWVPPDLDDPPVTAAAPPAARSEIVARLQVPEQQPGFGATDPDTDVATDRRAFFNADIALIGEHLGVDLLPAWAILESSRPPQPDDVLRPLEPIELGDGPHLEYAFQWFGIGLAAVVTYAAWVWRSRRRDEGRSEVEG